MARIIVRLIQDFSSLGHHQDLRKKFINLYMFKITLLIEDLQPSCSTSQTFFSLIFLTLSLSCDSFRVEPTSH